MIRPLADGTQLCEHCQLAAPQVPQLNKDATYIALVCTRCGTTSYHPATGDGICRKEVQQMFLTTLANQPGPNKGNQAVARATLSASIGALNAAFGSNVPVAV